MKRTMSQKRMVVRVHQGWQRSVVEACHLQHKQWAQRRIQLRPLWGQGRCPWGPIPGLHCSWCGRPWMRVRCLGLQCTAGDVQQPMYNTHMLGYLCQTAGGPVCGSSLTPAALSLCCSGKLAVRVGRRHMALRHTRGAGQGVHEGAVACLWRAARGPAARPGACQDVCQVWSTGRRRACTWGCSPIDTTTLAALDTPSCWAACWLTPQDGACSEPLLKMLQPTAPYSLTAL